MLLFLSYYSFNTNRGFSYHLCCPPVPNGRTSQALHRQTSWQLIKQLYPIHPPRVLIIKRRNKNVCCFRYGPLAIPSIDYFANLRYPGNDEIECKQYKATSARAGTDGQQCLIEAQGLVTNSLFFPPNFISIV